jgi:hypothetical protein
MDDKGKTGWWISATLYPVMVTLMYIASTPTSVGHLAEREERGFHVAAVRLKKSPDEARFVGYTLQQLKSGKVDPESVSFLLPDGAVDIRQADSHQVTVLERHADWQLVEYRHGNTHDTVSRYRAFRDRVEPVSYRITMHAGVVLWALLLLIPAGLLGALVNFALKILATRRAR